MAIRLGDIFVAIRAENDKLKGDLDAAKGQATSWASGLAGTLKGALGGALLGGVTALTGAVAGIGVAAFTAASDFDAATKKMQSQLGTSDTIAKNYGETLRNVFANNFGDSIDDVADSLTKVEGAFQRIGGTESMEQLQQATESAIALRDTFQVEVNETTSAAITLMENFGITSKEAFDFIAFGFQNGLDGSGDFLDTIGEYSTQFANGGADASQFFSLLQTGMQGGMLGTDKAADAFKEFRLRIQDGSETTAAGLGLLGINATAFTKELATGSKTAIDAFEDIIYALGQIEDPTIRMQAGAALLGTQYEDLGDSVVLGMSTAASGLGEMEGAINKLNKQYETIPAFFEGLRRRALVAIEPIGAALLSTFNKALPALNEWFTTVEGWVKDFIANSNFEWSPDIKQIKLGDLFEWISSPGLGVQRIKLADFFDLTWTGAGIQQLTLGDVFSFSAGEGTSINLGDYVHFIYDAESGAVAIKLEDVFTFVSDENGTVIDLSEYVTFAWGGGDITKFTLGDFFDFSSKDGVQIANFELKEFLWSGWEDNNAPITQSRLFQFGEKLVDIGRYTLGDFFLWLSGDVPTKTTTAELFDLSAKAEVDQYTISDFFDFLGLDQAKITYGDIFDFTLGEGGITKLKLGDFIDVEGVTATQLFGGALEELAAGLGEAANAPPWVMELINWKPSAGAPEWVDSLLAWVWPAEPVNISTLLSWAWPDAPTDISTLLSWAWPDAPGDISTLLSWAWPDFSAGLTSIINRITSFQWPTLAAPTWLTQLTDLTIPTPAWVTGLINALNGFTFPDLNPFNNDVNPDATSSGSIGGRSALTRSAPLVQMGDVIVKDRQDAEALAYGIARRLAYR